MTFNKPPTAKLKKPRPNMAPQAKEVWLAASMMMYNHFKEYGIEHLAVCYIQKPVHDGQQVFNSLNWEDEVE